MQKATKKLPTKKRRLAPKKASTGRLNHVQTLKEELKEALEQQAATREILRVISSSPTDVQLVFETIAQSAMRLCGGVNSNVVRFDGELIHLVAQHNIPTSGREFMQRLFPMPPGRGFAVSRAILERALVHIPDVQQDRDLLRSRAAKTRSLVAVPMLRDRNPIGAIAVARAEPGPFSDKKIALLQTFADQAVIAIENVRLFNETKEALEQQTATSEILGVIASSPTDIQPVLDTIVENAARVCDATDAVFYRLDDDGMVSRAGHYGPLPLGPQSISPLTRGSPLKRAISDRQTVHVHDITVPELEKEYPESKHSWEVTGSRTILATPLLREGVAIGAIHIRRTEVRPFTDKHIALLKTFADQAVIAIENVRLFQELQARNRELTEAAEQQIATSEVLKVISRSAFDLEPVLETLIENATRLCDAEQGGIARPDGDIYRMAVSYGFSPELKEFIKRNPIPPLGQKSVTGRVASERRTVHIHDVLADPDYQFEAQKVGGFRTILGVPMLREGIPIGVIAVFRNRVQPFTAKQIELVETFADQAVIAIENVRLFQELEARNRDLTEALEQQTATSEILQVIASSPTDIQPVLEVVAENAARLCEATDAHVSRVEDDVLRLMASYGSMPLPHDVGEGRPITRGNPAGRAIIDRETIHIHDITAEFDTEFAEAKAVHTQQSIGSRTILATPLLREGIPIGTIIIRRREVRPFTDKQIALLKTFADQAVIAIENVRLFQELQARNRDLTEALEQQTATGEILQAIASSPTDLQPVLDVVAKNAARLCDTDDAAIARVTGDHISIVAHYGLVGGSESIDVPMSRASVTGRSIIDRETVLVEDWEKMPTEEFPVGSDLSRIHGIRMTLAMPLLREGVAIGTIVIRRKEYRPFSETQMRLLKTFADQAVIAIENVRLFQELKEALEQQTATSEILGVIANSPTNIQPVLDTVAATAARLCEATDAQIRFVEGDGTRLVASFGTLPAPEFVPNRRETPGRRAILGRQIVHVHDWQSERGAGESLSGTRTFLSVPMLREGIPIGLINIRRTEVRPFSEKQVALIKTFADQAVIAIENVRLFQELEARTRELARSVEELKALGEVAQAVSSTLDLETVLRTIVTRAIQLSETSSGIIYEYEEATQELHLRASYQMEEELVDAYRETPLRLGQGATGRAADTKVPVQVVNLLSERELAATRIRPMLARHGYQSLLAVPLLVEQKIMGTLTVYRRESGSFKQEFVNLLQTFATQSALAIQNARLFREIEDKSLELEAANRHKSEFLANMSHELRTPLNAIIGFSEVLLQHLFGELNEKQNEYVDDVLSSGRHLLSLINDILDLSKVEAGRMELELAKFDLTLAIENALTLIRERAARHGISLHREVDKRLGDFVGDERLIKQILLNLLSNAVKFTPEGGRVEVRAVMADGSVEISVNDTGIGIAPEDQGTIFEEFRQVGSPYTQKREGTGLGLTLTKKFVAIHGGKIWVESEVGKGSTFTFSLPIS